MTPIQLEGSPLLWRELARHSDVNAVLEAAVERLRGAGCEAIAEATGLAVVTTDFESETLGQDLGRIVSHEPYLVNGKYVFLPLSYEALPGLVLEWGGSLAASRAHQARLPAQIGEASLSFDRVENQLHIERNTESDDVVVLYGGVPLRRPQPVTMPQLLYVTRRSDPSYELQYVLFRDPSDVVWFGESLRLATSYGGTGQEPWTCTALEAAANRGSRFSLMLVDRAAGERRDLVAALPTNVKRTVGYSADVLFIAAEGAEDDLVVHSDQLREHLANPTVTIADAIAAPGETPSALYLRLKAQLGR